MKVLLTSKPQAMMSLAFSKAKRWQSSIVRSFHRYFSSSVIWITKGTSNTSCNHLRQGSFHLEILQNHQVVSAVWMKNLTLKLGSSLGIHTSQRANSLCKDKGDEVTNVHGLWGRTSSCVKVEGLLLLIRIQYLLHISARNSDNRKVIYYNFYINSLQEILTSGGEVIISKVIFLCWLPSIKLKNYWLMNSHTINCEKTKSQE